MPQTGGGEESAKLTGKRGKEETVGKGGKRSNFSIFIGGGSIVAGQTFQLDEK